MVRDIYRDEEVSRTFQLERFFSRHIYSLFIVGKHLSLATQISLVRFTNTSQA
jgi:hypothetical protein